jgi:nucleotide-binding universal stress UspA family protein
VIHFRHLTKELFSSVTPIKLRARDQLRRQKRELDRLGVSAEVHLRHGIVIDQIFEEVREGNYDLIVTGTSQARGLLRHYIMGDLTRDILNRANVPVLVARASPPKPARTL